jgi:hypothetical protein
MIDSALQAIHVLRGWCYAYFAEKGRAKCSAPASHFSDDGDAEMRRMPVFSSQPELCPGATHTPIVLSCPVRS